jgi:ribosomal protein L37AE/L43A
MPDYPFKQTAEIQITCPRCGYCMTRTVARLRRETKILCPSCGGTIAPGAEQVDEREASTRDDE